MFEVKKLDDGLGAEELRGALRVRRQADVDATVAPCS